MKHTIIVILTFTFIFGSCIAAGAKDGSTSYDLNKDEILVLLNYHFKSDPDVGGKIQGMSIRRKGRDIVYMYKGKVLDKLDKETLYDVLVDTKKMVSQKNLAGLQSQLAELQMMQTKKDDKMVR